MPAYCICPKEKTIEIKTIEIHGLSRWRRKDKAAPRKNTSSTAEPKIANSKRNNTFNRPVSSTIEDFGPINSKLIPTITMML